MNLQSFKELVDATCLFDGAVDCSREVRDLDVQIRSCFTQRESDQARYFARRIVADLGLRYLSDREPPEPYLSIARAIISALSSLGTSNEASSDWSRAIEIARNVDRGRKPEDEWKHDLRANRLSTSIKGLRCRGFTVNLLPSGGIEIPDEDLQRLAAEIERLAASLGMLLVKESMGEITKTYNAFTGRFHIGRRDTLHQPNASPEMPLAYLYHLGLRYIDRSVSAVFPPVAYHQLLQLTSWAVTIMDVSLGHYELMFVRPSNMLDVMRKSLAYDSVYLLTQAKPKHAREYLMFMTSQPELINLKNADKISVHEVREIAQALLLECEHSCSIGMQNQFMQVNLRAIALRANLHIDVARDIIGTVFTHSQGVNQKLTYPPHPADVNAEERPIVQTARGLFLQPAPLAARAVVNAALWWCKLAWPKKDFDSEVLGDLFERFVRTKLTEKGVTVLHGDYTASNSESECDALVETNEAVIVFELKSKLLTRKAKGGDDVEALVDLAQAIVRPQAQAMERHAVLVEDGSISLGEPLSTVTIGNREVLRVSITRGDLGSIHDRPFLQRFLQTGCIVEFLAANSEQQKKFKPVHSWFAKLKAATFRANVELYDTAFPFSESWSLSIFHLLMLLENTNGNESFSRELQRTRRVITPGRDFYDEYAYMRWLQEKFKPSPQHTAIEV